MEKASLVIRVCDFITKYSIFALIFLVPVFFLPWTADVLDFNKQALLLVLVCASLFSLMLKVLVSGKIELNKSFAHILAGILFLVYLLATIFSIYRHGSFWGLPQQISESMITMACLLIFYFLVSNVLSRKDIFTSVLVLAFSVTIAELIGVLQLFGLFILPFDFAKSVAFNLVGSIGSLGFLSAILLPLAIAMLIIVKKWWRVLFVAQIILSALALFLINYPIIWWVVIVGSALMLALGMVKRDLFDGRWMALPMFFLAVSLFFLLLNPQTGWLPQRANEILLSQKTGLDIAMQSMKERPIFGSGPGTFAYDFSKFKNPSFSASPLWNVVFNKSSSKFLNNLTTTGVLGFLAILAFLALPVFYGVKWLIFRRGREGSASIAEPVSQVYHILLLGLAVALAGQIIAYFLYGSNIVLDFICFFVVAAIVGLTYESKKEYVLKPSSLFTLITTFIFTLVFIFGLGIIILNGQRYFAEVSYYKGLASYQAGQKAEGLKNLELSASLNPGSDFYFRQLSQAYLLAVQDEMQNAGSDEPSDQQKTKIQALVSNSINAAKIATDINPNDSANWSLRGYIYQSLLGISGDASTWAISSYDSALKLDPNNPYLFAQKGNVHLADALILPQGATDDQKNQLLEKSQTQLEKSVSLNPNYSNALYSLGIVYDLLDEEKKTIDVFTKLKQLNPADESIQKILDNLNAGRPAFQQSSPVTATPPSDIPSLIAPETNDSTEE